MSQPSEPRKRKISRERSQRNTRWGFGKRDTEIGWGAPMAVIQPSAASEPLTHGGEIAPESTEQSPKNEGNL